MIRRRGYLLFEFGITLPLLAAVGIVVVVAMGTYAKVHTIVRTQLISLDRAERVLLDLQSGRASLASPPVDATIELLDSPQPQVKWVRVVVGKSSLIGAVPGEVSR